MIAIFGATGKIGGAAAAELRRLGLRVRAVVRDRARGAALERMGCEITTADLHDRRSVAEALTDAERALVICPLAPKAADVLADAQGVIDTLGAAIEAARPRQVVAISDYGAERPRGTGITMVFHRLEERLRGVPTAMTFLRSAEHMQNWARQLTPARDRGVLPTLHHPVSKVFPTVSAPDVGRVAAALLAADGPRPAMPRVVHVEGPRRYTASAVAESFARVLGRPVIAVPLERERWVSALLSAGLGESYARLVVELQDAHNAGHIDAQPGGEVRRGTTELDDALAALHSP